MYRCETCGTEVKEIHEVVAPVGLQCCISPVYITVEEDNDGSVPQGFWHCSREGDASGQ